ncbi:MAG: UDP-N-acetylglucosamine 2-epimerase (non-hydrolyzing), partial [Acidobacteria bacterium]
DVNSTVAAALVCAKLLIAAGHVEAGLRSFDRRMPEEVNRVVTDRIADLLFTPSADADENLRREGIEQKKIHRVGNVMIDSLVRLLTKADGRSILKDLSLTQARYALVTLHRPSNVDNPAMLHKILKTLSEIAEALPVIFPVHPRTRRHVAQLQSADFSSGLTLIEPIGYLEFLSLGVPCLTVRENTERPVTVEVGTNTLVGTDMGRLKEEVHTILSGRGKRGSVPPLWDGKTGERIAGIIYDLPFSLDAISALR